MVPKRYGDEILKSPEILKAEILCTGTAVTLKALQQSSPRGYKQLEEIPEGILGWAQQSLQQSPWKNTFLCSEHLSVGRRVLSGTGTRNNRGII